MDTVLGIDIAKETFDICLVGDGRAAESGQFANSAAGLKQLGRFLNKRRVSGLHACLEATGQYGDEVAHWLYGQGYAVSVVNPVRIKAYAKSQLRRTKTDKLDAAIIADFCRTQQPPLWTPPPPEWWTLRGLVRHLDDLETDRQRQRNRRAAGTLPPLVQTDLDAQIALLTIQIDTLKQHIQHHLDQHPHLKAQKDLLKTIPGIGSLTSAKLLAEFRDLSAFTSVKQLVAFAGLNPCVRQSGTSLHPAPQISKMGRASIRAALFMPALVAQKHNPLLAAFAARLKANGLKPMQVVVAVMRKLLHLVYGVLKSNRPFDPAFALLEVVSP